jgi:hypothetical protein
MFQSIILSARKSNGVAKNEPMADIKGSAFGEA